jgi:hypothetical protein
MSTYCEQHGKTAGTGDWEELIAPIVEDLGGGETAPGLPETKNVPAPLQRKRN